MGNTTTPGTSRDLAALVDDGWRPCPEGLRSLGRARLGERTPVGGSYHDLVAPVAAWEDLTAGRLRTFRETAEQTRPAEAQDGDAFNARVVETQRLVGPEALLAELDPARRRFVREIERLSDEQVATDVRDRPFGWASWAVAIVGGNWYCHQAERLAEFSR